MATFSTSGKSSNLIPSSSSASPDSVPGRGTQSQVAPIRAVGLPQLSSFSEARAHMACPATPENRAWVYLIVMQRFGAHDINRGQANRTPIGTAYAGADCPSRKAGFRQVIAAVQDADVSWQGTSQVGKALCIRGSVNCSGHYGY